MTQTLSAPGAADQPTASPRPAAKPLTDGRKGGGEVALLWLFVVVPLLAFAAAVPVAWGWGLGWRDVLIALTFYYVSGLGVTVGFHRYLTHGSFKARRWLRNALAVAGSLSIEMSPIGWVAAHRRHHQFSDAEGDPHSPWRFGESRRGLAKGFLWAHMGWLFERERSNEARFAPDLLADPAMRRIDRAFPLLVVVTMAAPVVIGGLWSWSWQGALTAFFWGSLVRVALLHHVTWSINSVCHIVGEKPFASNDRATNFWPLAVLSFGESWHNLHHADPTCARHGVLRGQIDLSARVIWLFEKLGWVHDVRWPRPERLAAKRVAA